jgi:hypothetical protein
LGILIALELVAEAYVNWASIIERRSYIDIYLYTYRRRRKKGAAAELGERRTVAID